ncbi:unnamed protein product [Phyllotreta striolata]|uniref:Major facilitator superfamily (MFS) profile domain-containing protein n=1 Tax=Phyllotreta striolata TaxID=444603 RepID=A0A9N9XQX7_PHYSR|nr:unnamed protein product [Phyllotreta striolata]
MPSEKIEKVVMKPFKMDPMHSQQELVRDLGRERTLRDVHFREWVVVFILCFVNLINYMDRFTLAGVLDKVQSHFQISNDECGLLQTAFVLSYMLFAPLFGYLGDRYRRSWIMGAGVFLWSLTTLAGSYMDHFGWFICFRALVGIGEASYSTIAPTIISDYFLGNIRSKMLAFFYFAIPVGSGLGYIVGAETAKLLGEWQYALRVTPVLGIAAVLLILFVLQDPERGQSEYVAGHLETTPWLEDVKDIVQNRSFMLSTAGFTCVAFVAGALAWWGPSFIEKGIRLHQGDAEASDVAYKFGIISMVSGLVGVPFGSYAAQRLRPRYARIDANLCAAGLLASAPLVFLVCITARTQPTLCFALVFFAEFFLNLTWSIIADILNTAFIFGAITMLAGIIGLTLGAVLSQFFKKKYKFFDPLICGTGLLLSAPCLFAVTYAVTYNVTIMYILLFLGQVSLNLNWAIVGDILLYVVLPTRRSTAEGFQLLVSHAFGDAGSPYLIGVLSEAFRRLLSKTYNKDKLTTHEDAEVEFKSLQYALFSTCFVEILGGLFFLMTAFYIVNDKRKVEEAVSTGNSSSQLLVNQDNDQNIS